MAVVVYETMARTFTNHKKHIYSRLFVCCFCAHIKWSSPKFKTILLPPKKKTTTAAIRLHRVAQYHVHFIFNFNFSLLRIYDTIGGPRISLTHSMFTIIVLLAPFRLLSLTLRVFSVKNYVQPLWKMKKMNRVDMAEIVTHTSTRQWYNIRKNLCLFSHDNPSARDCLID